MSRSRALIAMMATCLACGPERDPVAIAVGEQARVCPQARIIAVLRADRELASIGCELDGNLPAGWVGGPVFEAGSPTVAALGQAAPGELGRFCSYAWSGVGQPDFDEILPVLRSSAHVETQSIAPDCSQGAARGQLDPEVGAAIQARFRAEIGWLSAASLGTGPELRNVEIAVVDTVSQQVMDEPELAPHNTHGVVVGAVITDIACPGGTASCRDDVHYWLGLPRTVGEDQPDWLRGGDVGTAIDVALAIYAAIEAWQRDGRARGKRLVINLSLGWEPPELERGPELALRTVLEYAACNEVLVIAAAGNDGPTTDGAHGRGPLMPASYEATRAPSAARCRELGFGGESSPDDRLRPLVYAVSGVDASGRALTTTRPASRSRLAAPALQAIAPLPDGDYTGALSGSSVAAAVATGVAALVWSHRPELHPDDLIELVYAGGLETGEPAEFGLEPGRQIRRVHACRALEHACADGPSERCPQLDCERLAADVGEASELVRQKLIQRRAQHPDTVRVHYSSTRQSSTRRVP